MIPPYHSKMAKQDEIATTAPTSGAGNSSIDSPPPHSSFPEYTDRTISTRDWASRNFADLRGQLIAYLVSLFPIATWIYRYNLTWLTGDVRMNLGVQYIWEYVRLIVESIGYCRSYRWSRCRAPRHELCYSCNLGA